MSFMSIALRMIIIVIVVVVVVVIIIIIIEGSANWYNGNIVTEKGFCTGTRPVVLRISSRT